MSFIWPFLVLPSVTAAVLYAAAHRRTLVQIHPGYQHLFEEEK